MSSGWHDGNEDGPRPAIFQTLDGGTTWERLSYRHLPAPWALYGALPGLLLALYGTAVSYRQIPNDRPRAGIQDIGWSDRPIGWSDPDVLGLKPLARALSRFLRNRDTEPPLTIAVSGPWGSGKSSLMNLVAQDLRRFGTRTVLFNAWHHQKEEHLLAALLANVRAQAIPPFWRLSGLMFRVHLFRLRMGKQIAGFAFVLALLVMAWFFLTQMAPGQADGLLALLKGSAEEVGQGLSKWDPEAFFKGLFGIGTLSATLIVAAKLLAQFLAFTNPGKLMASLSQKARVRDFAEQLSFRHHFACEFSEVCHALRHGPQAGLVIMIDDLDRCRPNNVVEVLEAINFLASAGPCFIFLGIAKPKVIEAISGELKITKDEAERYLEKLVNIEVFVPEATLEQSRSLSLPPERGRGSPWPDRIRSALRAAPDTLAPGALAAAVLLVALALMPSPGLVPPADQEPPPAQQNQAAADTRLPATGGATPSDGPSMTQGAPPPEPLTVSTDELAADPPWAAFALVAFALSAIGLAALRRSTNAEGGTVEDSADFRNALSIWHQVIFFTTRPTPRGIKRHQNRLRFQAMRLRPVEPEPDWLDRLFSGPESAAAEGGESSRSNISDAKLVAIGALDATNRSDLFEDIRDPLHSLILPPDIRTAVEEHARTFPDAWPLHPEEVDEYHGLSASIRG